MGPCGRMVRLGFRSVLSHRKVHFSTNSLHRWQEHFGITLTTVSWLTCIMEKHNLPSPATQYCDGMRGALIVYDPTDPHKNLYDGQCHHNI